MKALTLHRPWPWAILHLDPPKAKRIENRIWAPPMSVIGEVIALHAGSGFELQAAEYIRHASGHWPPGASEHPTGIVGVARVIGYCDPRPPGARARLHGPDLAEAAHVMTASAHWYMGSFGWLLGDVVALPTPIPCAGSRRLWTVPDGVEVAVSNALARRER